MTFALAVVGAAGSGKSTIALEIARRTDATYLDKDSLAGPLVEAAMHARGESLEERESNLFYRNQLMPAEYAGLFAVAGDNLRLGRSVVVDAPFAAYLGQSDFFDRSASSADWPEVERCALVVSASETETRRRLTERGLPRDRAKLGDWPAFWARWGQIEIAWTGVRILELDNDTRSDISNLVRML